MAQLPSQPPVLEPNAEYAECIAALSRYIVPITRMITSLQQELPHETELIQQMTRVFAIIKGEEKVSYDRLCQMAMTLLMCEQIDIDNEYQFRGPITSEPNQNQNQSVNIVNPNRYQCTFCQFTCSCAQTMISHKLGCVPFVFAKMQKNWNSFVYSRDEERQRKQAKAELKPEPEVPTVKPESNPASIQYSCEGCRIEINEEQALLEHMVNCETFLTKEILKRWSKSSAEYTGTKKRIKVEHEEE